MLPTFDVRTGVANISEKIREARLRWLGHVERKLMKIYNSNENMEVGGQRKIGRPKRGGVMRRPQIGKMSKKKCRTHLLVLLGCVSL